MVQLFVIKDNNSGEYYVRYTDRVVVDFAPFNVNMTLATHKKDAEKIAVQLRATQGRDLSVLALVASMAR
jgi:hypothetical protein